MRGFDRRSLVLAAVAVLAYGAASLSIPRFASACSCVAPEDIVDTAGDDPGASVFTATAGPKVGTAIPVAVTRWLKGTLPAPVTIEGGPDDDMCGSTSPPAGREYLFVTYTSEASRFAINGCSVKADTATTDGQALLARAITRYGPGAAPAPEDPPPSDGSGGASLDAEALVPVVLVGVFSVALVGGILVVWRSRSARPPAS